MIRRPAQARRPRLDPRLYQIAVLALLLVYGLTRLHFEIAPLAAAAILLTVLLTQLAGAHLAAGGRFEPKSALISGLSLCLLLRTPSVWLAVVTAAVTIASKFLLRWNGRHVWNPTHSRPDAARELLPHSQIAANSLPRSSRTAQSRRRCKADEQDRRQ